MALTGEQVYQEIVARELELRKQEGNWVIRQGGFAVRGAADPDLALAVEKATALINQRTAEAEERSARRILEAQQRGDFFVRPRVEVREIDGERVEVKVFDAVRADGTETAVRGRASVVEAWSDALREPAVNGVRNPPANGGAR